MLAVIFLFAIIKKRKMLSDSPIIPAKNKVAANKLYNLFKPSSPQTVWHRSLHPLAIDNTVRLLRVFQSVVSSKCQTRANTTERVLLLRKRVRDDKHLEWQNAYFINMYSNVVLFNEFSFVRKTFHTMLTWKYHAFFIGSGIMCY